MKLSITLDDDLVKRIDDYADKNYMSRSGLISLSATQFLNSNDIIFAIKDMSYAMRKIADSNELDDETIELLEDVERISKVFLSKKQ